MDSWTLRSLFSICKTMRKTWSLWWKALTGRMQVWGCCNRMSWIFALLQKCLLSFISHFVISSPAAWDTFSHHMSLSPLKAASMLRSSCSLFGTLVCIFPHSMRNKPLRGISIQPFHPLQTWTVWLRGLMSYFCSYFNFSSMDKNGIITISSKDWSNYPMMEKMENIPEIILYWKHSTVSLVICITNKKLCPQREQIWRKLRFNRDALGVLTGKV